MLSTRALPSIAQGSGFYVQVLPYDLPDRVGRGSWRRRGSRCATCVICIAIVLNVFSATGRFTCLGSPYRGRLLNDGA